MGRFPPQFVDDLKAQADIVQVVQDVVPLKKAGNSYKGLCPFHNEKTPSFHVNQDKGFFKCFGCGTGGDVVKFVELHEKLAFPEAVRLLAERFGVQVPESADAERDAAADARREALLKVHSLAAAWFQQQLAGPAGRGARAHLEARGIRPETIERLGLGYAPAQRDGLRRHLLDAGQQPDLLLDSGLIVERDGGRVLDRFRNRLMIPICRDSGAVVAFGGRALESGQQPKYMNSPESLLYTKSRTLYGLHLTKAAIRRLGYAVMVEGYFDLAQVVQAGVEPVVATCGTAVTAQQARLLRRFAAKVIVSFDPDTAGQAAATRTGALLTTEGLQVNIATLPEGEDPDTCVRRHGGERYTEVLRTSQRFFDCALEDASVGRDLSRNAQLTAFLSDMLTVIHAFPESVVREKHADAVMHRAGVKSEAVRADYRRAAVARRTSLGNVTTQSVGRRATTAEEGIIWATMHDTRAALDALAGTEPEDFKGLATESILRVARTLVEWPDDAVPRTLLERLNGAEADEVKRIAAYAHAPVEDVEDCARNLQRDRYKRERVELQDEIARRQQVGSDAAPAEIDALLRRKMELAQRIEQLGGSDTRQVPRAPGA